MVTGNGGDFTLGRKARVGEKANVESIPGLISAGN